MIPITIIAPLQGWRQQQPGGTVELLEHTFEATEDGQLQHRTGTEIRAIVPPESWLKYLEAWPEAEPIVEQLTRPTPKLEPGDQVAAVVDDAPIGAEIPTTMPAWLEPILMRLDRLEAAVSAPRTDAAAAEDPDQAAASIMPPAGA